MCGDLNYDGFNISHDNRAADFYERASALSFLPTIHKPTHISNNSFSLIDNILVNNLISFRSGVLSYDVSDHLPIFLIYKSIFSQNEQLSETVKFRKTFPNSSNNLLNKFSQINFERIVNLDCDSAIEELHENILFCYNYAYPIKTKSVSLKDKQKPWINLSIKKIIKQRQILYMLFKQNKTTSVTFNRFRNHATNEIRSPFIKVV